MKVLRLVIIFAIVTAQEFLPAQAAYPELLKLAENYVAAAAELQEILKKDQYAKKAKVGCIANTMKPGKANQVSIADDQWVSEETLKVCHMLRKLNEQIKNMILADCRI